MPSRLSIFTSDELAEIIYRLDLAGTIEPLPPEAEALSRNSSIYDTWRIFLHICAR